MSDPSPFTIIYCKCTHTRIHAHITHVHSDRRTGTLALICELMDMNMYELIKDRRSYLSESKVKLYMYQLCKAIYHMHRNGIFHRDVKPENILIKVTSRVLTITEITHSQSEYRLTICGKLVRDHHRSRHI